MSLEAKTGVGGKLGKVEEIEGPCRRDAWTSGEKGGVDISSLQTLHLLPIHAQRPPPRDHLQGSPLGAAFTARPPQVSWGSIHHTCSTAVVSTDPSSSKTH